jgi:hypothetical protein
MGYARRPAWGRLALLSLVILGSLPIWWREVQVAQPLQQSQVLTLTRLAVPPIDLGPLQVHGAWLLDSPNTYFGGYSALTMVDGGRLLAASDSGRRLQFTVPGQGPPRPQFDHFAAPELGEKYSADIEAVARDPRSGALWVAYEYTNRIERFDRAFKPKGSVQPAAMRRWRSNSGPEAMARLDDGRFIVLAESGGGWFGETVPALLFAADPVAGNAEKVFRFRPPSGFRPVDMAPLPDGRVLILLRRVLWGLPPRFAGRLVIADPATIRSGQEWSGSVLADLNAPLPSDNYEGLAVAPGADGTLTLWLISDDNNVTFQRTLLLALRWKPDAAR